MDHTGTAPPACHAPPDYAGRPLLATLGKLAFSLKVHLFPLPGQALENHLAGAADLVDLEQRLLEWQRRQARPGGFT